MNKEISMSPHRLVTYFQKPAAELTKADIIAYIREHDIRLVNFMYPAADGRLKTLNFVINNEAYLEAILTCGERVDGSSLFPFIEAGSSDLYVIPRFRTAFVDPFAETPTLTMLCSFFNKDGAPLESAPEYTLQKACRVFREKTGMEFQAMGELEYYVISEDDGMFPATDQHGYHESEPYAKLNAFRTRCMEYIAQTGGQIKYGHSEVGNFTLNGNVYEQNEIEFLPVPATEAADQLMLAKMGHPQPGLRIWIQHHVRPEDYCRKSRFGPAYPHAHHARRKEPYAVGRRTVGSGAQSHSRHDDTGAVHHCLRQHRAYILLQTRASPGSTDQHLLGRPQPLRTGARAARLVGRHRHVPAGNPLETASHFDTTQKQTVEMRRPTVRPTFTCCWPAWLWHAVTVWKWRTHWLWRNRPTST